MTRVYVWNRTVWKSFTNSANVPSSSVSTEIHFRIEPLCHPFLRCFLGCLCGILVRGWWDSGETPTKSKPRKSHVDFRCNRSLRAQTANWPLIGQPSSVSYTDQLLCSFINFPFFLGRQFLNIIFVFAFQRRDGRPRWHPFFLVLLSRILATSPPEFCYY